MEDAFSGVGIDLSEVDGGLLLPALGARWNAIPTLLRDDEEEVVAAAAAAVVTVVAVEGWSAGVANCAFDSNDDDEAAGSQDLKEASLRATDPLPQLLFSVPPLGITLLATDAAELAAAATTGSM